MTTEQENEASPDTQEGAAADKRKQPSGDFKLRKKTGGDGKSIKAATAITLAVIAAIGTAFGIGISIGAHETNGKQELELSQARDTINKAQAEARSQTTAKEKAEALLAVETQELSKSQTDLATAQTANKQWSDAYAQLKQQNDALLQDAAHLKALASASNRCDQVAQEMQHIQSQIDRNQLSLGPSVSEATPAQIQELRERYRRYADLYAPCLR